MLLTIMADFCGSPGNEMVCLLPGAFESESKILETSRFLCEYKLNVENFRIPQSLNSLALYLPGTLIYLPRKIVLRVS